MKFLNTSAADFEGFLTALRDFLTTWGWTVLVDDIGNRILEVTNSNGHDFRLSRTQNVVSRYDPTVPGYVNQNDYRLNLQYQLSDIGLPAAYSTAQVTNDMNGPFANLWFITDDAATYCHIIIQSSTYRYSHASFGNLDNKGAHASLIPYVCGNYYIWWRDFSSLTDNSSDFNDPSSSQHQIGYMAEAQQRIGLPDGIIDPALGFADGPIDNPSTRDLSRRFGSKSTSDTTTYWLDFFQGVRNQAYTGGVTLAPFPVFVIGSSGNICFVGEIPTIALVSMIGLSPSQVLTFASEEWVVFPMKRYGLPDNMRTGINPLDQTTSVNYGFAYRKT